MRVHDQLSRVLIASATTHQLPMVPVCIRFIKFHHQIQNSLVVMPAVEDLSVTSDAHALVTV